MHNRIVTTVARLDDAAEMTRFLAPIPNAAPLARLLAGHEPVSTRAYLDDARTALFIESDGRQVLCFAVPNVTIDQAEMIESRREALGVVDATTFQQAVDQALATL